MNFPSASDSLNITSTHTHYRPPIKYWITRIMLGEGEKNIAGLKCVPRRSGTVSSAQSLVERPLDHLTASSWWPSGLWFSHSLLSLTAVLCLEGWKASRDLQRWEMRKRKICHLTHTAQKKGILRNVQECFISCHRKILPAHWWWN